MLDKMTLTLSNQHLEIVLDALSHRPYREVAPVIQTIVAQARQQEAKHARATDTAEPSPGAGAGAPEDTSAVRRGREDATPPKK